MATTNGPKLPVDYEACSCCGWDHNYDLPYLTPKELRKAKALHDDIQELSPVGAKSQTKEV